MNVELVNATLYQPDSVLADRVDTDAFGLYIVALSESISEALATANEPEMLELIAIARPVGDDIEPGDNSRFWLLSSLEEPVERAELNEALRAVVVPPLTGPIAFALTFAVAGALPPAEHEQRAPLEWQMAAATVEGPGTPVVPDDLIPALWDWPIDASS
ncbi:MAG: hypothetical protein ACRBK7_10350 [Acidimicrobiales bacterium]